MPSGQDAEKRRLEAKLASFENLREDLGDATVDTKKREIEARIRTGAA